MNEDDPLYQIGKTVWELNIQLNDILSSLRAAGYQGTNTLILVKASIADCEWINLKVKELTNAQNL